jgi:hypothetical protein
MGISSLALVRFSGSTKLKLSIARRRICFNYITICHLPRGVTVTQRPLEALFMVRIHAR